MSGTPDQGRETRKEWPSSRPEVALPDLPETADQKAVNSRMGRFRVNRPKGDHFNHPEHNRALSARLQRCMKNKLVFRT